MLSFDEALARLLGLCAPLPAERVSVFEADGRVLAEEVVAPAPLPGFDYSAMDGYALAATDAAGEPPYALPLQGESSAGGTLPDVPPGAACRIFTGAPLPRGLDAVVMQENVTVEADGGEAGGGRRIRFATRVRAGEHVRRRGEDLAAGAVALARGTKLGPGHVALAAALDRAALAVARRPLVTIVGTGDELRSPGEAARPGTIVESNGFFVAAAARRAGADVRLAPFVSDDPEAARAAFAAALRGTDLLVTIGGVSVGDRDVVRPALEAAGVTIEFYKVAMKPGKPLTVGRAERAMVLGLPGNPASASLTFLLFGVPVIRALLGEARPLPSRRRLRVEGKLSRKPGRQEFARATLRSDGAAEWAELAANQASGAVTSFACADALVVIPAEHGDAGGGEVLDVIPLDAITA